MKLSDNIIGRIAQIVQESMLLGSDCVDALRDIDVVQDENDVTQLVMTVEYESKIVAMHKELLEKAEKLKEQQSNNPIDLQFFIDKN